MNRKNQKKGLYFIYFPYLNTKIANFNNLLELVRNIRVKKLICIWNVKNSYALENYH